MSTVGQFYKCPVLDCGKFFKMLLQDKLWKNYNINYFSFYYCLYFSFNLSHIVQSLLTVMNLHSLRDLLAEGVELYTSYVFDSC